MARMKPLTALMRCERGIETGLAWDTAGVVIEGTLAQLGATIPLLDEVQAALSALMSSVGAPLAALATDIADRGVDLDMRYHDEHQITAEEADRLERFVRVHDSAPGRVHVQVALSQINRLETEPVASVSPGDPTAAPPPDDGPPRDPGDPPPHGLTLQVAPDDRQEALIRLLLRRCLAGRWDDDDDVLTLFLTAVSEIVSNAMDAHRRAGLSRPITVGFSPGRSALVTVRDAGTGFDPANVVTGDGLGLTLARGICPELWIESHPGNTLVTLPVPASSEGRA